MKAGTQTRRSWRSASVQREGELPDNQSFREDAQHAHSNCITPKKRPLISVALEVE